MESAFMLKVIPTIQMITLMSMLRDVTVIVSLNNGPFLLKGNWYILLQVIFLYIHRLYFLCLFTFSNIIQQASVWIWTEIITMRWSYIHALEQNGKGGQWMMTESSTLLMVNVLISGMAALMFMLVDVMGQTLKVGFFKTK